METQSMQPFVRWMAKARNGHIYRIVDRGPQRPGTNDRQFVFEVAAGHDGMFVQRWMPLKPHQCAAAIELLVERFGKLLLRRIDDLKSWSSEDHLLGCEMIQARIEGRQPRGCDCLGAPGRYGRPDPLDKDEREERRQRFKQKLQRVRERLDRNASERRLESEASNLHERGLAYCHPNDDCDLYCVKQACDEWLTCVVFTRPGLPYGSTTFYDHTLEEFRDRVIMLRNTGYRVPDFVLSDIEEESRLRDLYQRIGNSQC